MYIYSRLSRLVQSIEVADIRDKMTERRLQWFSSVIRSDGMRRT